VTRLTNGGAPRLGDFTATPRVLLVAALAVPVGALAAGVAWLLLHLIGLITNLVFYSRVASTLVAPDAQHHNPILIVLAPVVGGLVIGVMARYGSEKIRGHGMPEALEAILTGGSKVQPRVAALKPVASAIAIGTGGPFGAEGPIIMTGGAFGSLVAQFVHLTADERKTLLVAGAAGGMAATFNTPFAAVVLAVELLLFEWRPRSYIPVATAVAVATAVRSVILGDGTLFRVAQTPLHLTVAVDGLAVVSGVIAGVLAVVATAKAMVFDGAILFLALAGAVGQDSKKAARMGERWHEWTAQTAFVPFARGFANPGTIALIGGTLLFFLATWAHPIPAGFWRWIG